jgi:hypothetical protein
LVGLAEARPTLHLWLFLYSAEVLLAFLSRQLARSFLFSRFMVHTHVGIPGVLKGSSDEAT